MKRVVNKYKNKKCESVEINKRVKWEWLYFLLKIDDWKTHHIVWDGFSYEKWIMHIEINWRLPIHIEVHKDKIFTNTWVWFEKE